MLSAETLKLLGMNPMICCHAILKDISRLVSSPSNSLQNSGASHLPGSAETTTKPSTTCLAGPRVFNRQQEAEGEKILRDLARESKSAHVSPYMIATIYAGLGQKDRAFEFLDKAYLEKALDLTLFLKADPRIDSLRSDPRFQSLLRRVGLSA
jgi:hypothetical protein